MRHGNPKILVIKLSAIGDVIHSLPFLEVLKDTFPFSTIDWVVEEDAADIVQDHPDIDTLIIFSRKSWIKRFAKKNEYRSIGKEVADFLKVLKKKRYDIVIDLQGLLKSGILTFISRGKRKIGLNGGREASSIFINERVVVPDPDIHALERYLYITRYLGATKTGWSGRVPIDAADTRYINDLLQGIDDTPLIAVNPMAKWETKLWGLNRFACLVDRIKETLGAEVIFTGSESDRKQIETILSKMNTRVLNFAGKSTLKELACLYERCAIVISTDTGPMHLAAAMNNPVVVALFGPTSPLKTGPYGPRHRVLRTGIECSPCFKKKCIDMSCMKEITVDMVFNIVKEVLESI